MHSHPGDGSTPQLPLSCRLAARRQRPVVRWCRRCRPWRCNVRQRSRTCSVEKRSTHGAGALARKDALELTGELLRSSLLSSRHRIRMPGAVPCPWCTALVSQLVSARRTTRAGGRAEHYRGNLRRRSLQSLRSLTKDGQRPKRSDWPTVSAASFSPVKAHVRGPEESDERLKRPNFQVYETFARARARYR